MCRDVVKKQISRPSVRVSSRRGEAAPSSSWILSLMRYRDGGDIAALNAVAQEDVCHVRREIFKHRVDTDKYTIPAELWVSDDEVPSE